MKWQLNSVCRVATQRAPLFHAAHLFSRDMAEAKSPAATCSAARWHFCIHRWLGGTPGVGGMKAVSSPGAACTSWVTSAGSSRSYRDTSSRGEGRAWPPRATLRQLLSTLPQPWPTLGGDIIMACLHHSANTLTHAGWRRHHGLPSSLSRPPHDPHFPPGCPSQPHNPRPCQDQCQSTSQSPSHFQPRPLPNHHSFILRTRSRPLTHLTLPVALAVPKAVPKTLCAPL